MEIQDAGAVAGRDVVLQGTNVAGRDVVIHHQTVQAAVAPSVIPRELPPNVTGFVDRVAAAEELRRALTRAIEGQGTAIATISGPPGVGKTALVLRVAHGVASSIDGGILFMDLSGGQAAPLDSSAVLGEFLLALGADRIPESLESRARAYRSMLSDRRHLVVLDNARDEQQLRPLLPGAPGCAVLVTSRRRLRLPERTADVSLEAFGEAEALDLLALLAGDERVDGETEQARRIVQSCGGLPLALQIVGARLDRRPQWPLARLADRLSDERRRLKELDMGNDEIRAGFTATYQGLDDEARRLFRHLGVLDLLDVPAWLPGPLLDVQAEDGEDATQHLVEAHLLQAAAGPQGPRYRFHDLLRSFARDCAEQESSPPERQQVLDRALAAYLVLAARADAGFSASNSAIWDPPPPEAHLSGRLDDAAALSTGPSPEHEPLEWFSAERVNLLRLMGQAYREQRWAAVWRLTGTLWQFLEVTGRLGDWSLACELGGQAAEQAGDTIAQSTCWRLLGRQALTRGAFAAAQTHLTAALDLLAGTDYLHGECMIRKDLSVLERLRNQHLAASELLSFALEGFERLGEGYWIAVVERELGIEYRFLGRAGEASRLLLEAATTFEDLGEALQGAQTYFELGVMHRQQSEFDQAAESFDRAAPAAERLDARGLRAWLGRERALVAAGRGDLEAAVALLSANLELWRDLDDRRQYAATQHALALALRQSGDLDQARVVIRGAVDTLAVVDAAVDRARALVTLADLDLAGDLPEAASDVAQQAVALLRAHQDVFWEMKAHRVLAQAFTALGDDQAAGHSSALAAGLEPNAGVPTDPWL